MLADRGVDLPALALLLEILDQQLDRQAALHLELRVEPGLRLVEDLGREVGRDDLEASSRRASPAPP